MIHLQRINNSRTGQINESVEGLEGPDHGIYEGICIASICRNSRNDDNPVRIAGSPSQYLCLIPPENKHYKALMINQSVPSGPAEVDGNREDSRSSKGFV
jgi:hypothetical protein